MTSWSDHSLDRHPDRNFAHHPNRSAGDWTSSWKVPVFDAVKGPALDPGEILGGRYRIDAYLARGGMGVVYRATDMKLGVRVALKTIRPEIALDPASLRRFKQEVLLARSISHPHVCRIHDLGHDSKREVSFLTMEFLEGETLAERLRTKRTFTPEEALPIVRQVTDALDAAHRAGVIHRDFKSSNVMLVPGDSGERAVITDFGLAVGAQSHEASAYPPRFDPTTAGSVRDERDDTSTTILAPVPGQETAGPIYGMIGTPEYMSPEQVVGAGIGPASDLYALGIVLYEMTTGRLPFRAATRVETARLRLETEPPPPTQISRDLPPEWENVVLRLLARSPEQRPRSGRDVVLGLEGESTSVNTVGYALPAERDAFVGRYEELHALFGSLESGAAADRSSQLTTVLGFAGTGKTRLVQRYGWESLTRWPGGVWFCDLSEAKTVDGIAAAVGSTLGVPLSPGDAIVQLGHAIAGRGRSLVILDNFEQVAAYAEATLGQWLDRCPQARFLVTSRERLDLPGENVLSLDALEPATQGVALFELRGQSHRPGFLVDEANRSVVEETVRRLDGIPLAIELAASRLRVLSLNELRDRLADRFQLLAGSRRGRRATLQTTLDWSWDLLRPWEQSAMAQASAFVGGFTLEAAEAVIDLSGFEDAPSMLDVVQSLVDKSWVRTRVFLGAPRFEMYTTVQEYASGRLEQLDRVAVRHGKYFAQVASPEAIASLDGRDGVRKWAALRAELDNLVPACHSAILRRDEETATRTLVAIEALTRTHGPAQLAVRLGQEVLELAAVPRQRASVLAALGSAKMHAGKPGEATGHFEAAISIVETWNDPLASARLYHNLGTALRYEGAIDKPRELWEAALVVFQEHGDRQMESNTLVNLGVVHWVEGRNDEARRLVQQALAIACEIDDRRLEGLILNNIAIFKTREGNVDEALGIFAEALQLHREAGNRLLESQVLSILGVVYTEQGRKEEATEAFRAALIIQREMGSRRGEGLTLGNLGILRFEQGRIEEARELYESALVVHREVGNVRAEGNVLTNLGNLCLDQDHIQEAQEAYEAALTIERSVGNDEEVGVIRGRQGYLHLKRGQLSDARRSLEESVRALRARKRRLELGNVLCFVGQLELEEGDIESAQAALDEAESIARDLAVTEESELAHRVHELRARLTPETH